jgi:hypothetical protein
MFSIYRLRSEAVFRTFAPNFVKICLLQPDLSHTDKYIYIYIYICVCVCVCVCVCCTHIQEKGSNFVGWAQ